MKPNDGNKLETNREVKWNNRIDVNPGHSEGKLQGFDNNTSNTRPNSPIARNENSYRPNSANPNQTETNNRETSSPIIVNRHEQLKFRHLTKNPSLKPEDITILGLYRLDEEQQHIYDQFLQMISTFDTFDRVSYF